MTVLCNTRIPGSSHLIMFVKRILLGFAVDFVGHVKTFCPRLSIIFSVLFSLLKVSGDLRGFLKGISRNEAALDPPTPQGWSTNGERAQVAARGHCAKTGDISDGLHMEHGEATIHRDTVLQEGRVEIDAMRGSITTGVTEGEGSAEVATVTLAQQDSQCTTC